MPTWYDTASFLLHYAHPFSPNDSPVPLSSFDPEQVERLLGEVKPDAVVYLVKGSPGFVPYPTSYDNGLPYLVAGHDPDPLDHLRQITHRLGIRLVFGYNGLMDMRAGDFRPDWRQVNSTGNVYPHRALCVNSGYVEELLLPQLAEIQERYSPDGFWMDGENWAIGPCYCNACLTEYQMLHAGSAPLNPRDEHWARWIEFHRESFRRYVSRVSRYLHDHGIDCVYCSSGAWSSNQPEALPDSSGSGPNRLSREIQPAYNLRASGLEARLLDSRGIGFDLLYWNRVSARPKAIGTLSAQPAYAKSLEHLAQEVSVALASGGRVTLGIAVPSDDLLPEGQHDVAGQVAAFVRERAEWSIESESAAVVAILHSAATHRKAGNGLFDPGPSLDRIRGAHQALLELHCPHDILDEHTLLQRLDRYQVIILPEQVALENAVDEPLTEWVRTGGRLIASGRVSPRIIEDLQTFALEDVLGLRWTGRHEAEGYFGGGDAPLHVGAPCYYVSPLTAETIWPLLSSARELTQRETGYPALTRNVFEEGEAYYLAGDFFAAYYRSQYPAFRELLRDVLNRATPMPHLMTSAPSTVEITLRCKEGALLVHFVNHASGRPLGENGVFVENVPSTPPFSLTLGVPEQPETVVLQPGGEAPEWSWAEGTLTVFLPALHIHSALEIR
jgi:hypothetical protein